MSSLHEPTLTDVLQEMRSGFAAMAHRFDGLEEDLHITQESMQEYASSMETRMNEMATKDDLDKRFQTFQDVYLEGRLQNFESSLATKFVTKGYLDDKLADLRSDIIGYFHRFIPSAATAAAI